MFLVIMVGALAVAAVVVGRAQRGPSPDNPTRPEPGDDVIAADDPRDRPAGPETAFDAPHSSQLQPGEVADPSVGGENVAHPSGGMGSEEDRRDT